jgi:hypothetical protein
MKCWEVHNWRFFKDVREIEWCDVDWIDLALDVDR